MVFIPKKGCAFKTSHIHAAISTSLQVEETLGMETPEHRLVYERVGHSAAKGQTIAVDFGFCLFALLELAWCVPPF